MSKFIIIYYCKIPDSLMTCPLNISIQPASVNRKESTSGTSSSIGRQLIMILPPCGQDLSSPDARLRIGSGSGPGRGRDRVPSPRRPPSAAALFTRQPLPRHSLHLPGFICIKPSRNVGKAGPFCAGIGKYGPVTGEESEWVAGGWRAEGCG